MIANSVELVEVSTDSDTYTLTFSLQEDVPVSMYKIVSDAIHYRMSQIIEENELKVLGMSVKIDCFEFQGCASGYIEMDTLAHTQSISALDAYLYNEDNVLRAKASCTVQYEKVMRVPAY